MQQGRPAIPTPHLVRGVLAPVLTLVSRTWHKLLCLVQLYIWEYLINLRELFLVLLSLRAALARLPSRPRPNRGTSPSDSSPSRIGTWSELNGSQIKIPTHSS